jgi:hypothetical protein
MYIRLRPLVHTADHYRWTVLEQCSTAHVGLVSELKCSPLTEYTSLELVYLCSPVSFY